MTFDSLNNKGMNTHNPLTSFLIKAAVVLFIILISVPAKLMNHILYGMIKTKESKMLLFFIALFVGGIGTASVTAQSLKHYAYKHQFGFEASFGVKSFQINSNLAPINHMKVMEEGGTVGIIGGNNVVRLKLRQGYYYSSSSVANSVDNIRSSFTVNLYPLQLLAKNYNSFQVYFMGGLERSILKMYGFYGGENTTSPAVVNYSISEAPYLGKISTLQASVGGGIEYSIRKPGHFVHLFGEVKYSKPFSSTATPFFTGTATSNQLSLNVGIGFGYYR
jgi:hypothetical protein